MDTINQKKKKGIPSTRAYRKTLDLTPEQYEKRVRILNENRQKAQQKVKEFFNEYQKQKKMKTLISLHDEIGDEVVKKEDLDTEKAVCDFLITDYEKECDDMREEYNELQEECDIVREECDRLHEVIKRLRMVNNYQVDIAWKSVFG